jgi:hypothetical protein
MTWTRPTFDTIKMDAEIGSYQQDGDRHDVPGADVATHTVQRSPRLARPSSTHGIAVEDASASR